MTVQQGVGRWGGQAAADYLEKQGYQILARNFRAEHGEVDIIAQQDKSLVFIEVKARSSNRYGFPEYSVTPKKRMHILSAAQKYILEHPEFQTWRVDVITVESESGAAVSSTNDHSTSVSFPGVSITEVINQTSSPPP